MSSKEDIGLQMINDMFRSRTALISFLREKLKLKLPKKTKSEEAIKQIIEKGKEREFCEAIFEEMELNIKVASFEKAYGIYKLGFLLAFFSVKDLVQMADELSKQQTKWKFRKRNRRLLIQSILRNVTVREIENYVQERIRNKEIPPIQANKFGWILGPMGLLRSAVHRKFTMVEDMTKFLVKHVNYPSPYLELKEKVADKLDLPINKHDPLLKQKICQLLLARLNDKEIFEVFNQLIDEEIVRIPSIERYWNFVVTPFGVFEPPYSGEKNLAKAILRTFQKEELRPRIDGEGTIEDLIQQKCIVDPPDAILTEFFGSGPFLIKLAKEIGMVGLHTIKNDTIFIESVLLRLGFDVPPELESIVSARSKLQGYLKQVKNGIMLAEGKWNSVYNFLERILADLILFYGSVLHEQKLRGLEEEKKESEIKNWIKKTFQLKKQFDYLTLGDLCALLRNMNRFSKTSKTTQRLMSKIFRRVHFVKQEHLRELDFVVGCRTELTKIHRRKRRKECGQREVLERLVSVLRDWNSEKGLSRTYPCAIRLKEEVTTEFGVRYYTVANEEGRVLKLKTNKSILPEDIWFMVGRNDIFPIDPVLVKKYW